jgi:hypothetical protein
MPVKVNVNGLTMVHQGSEGKAAATIPDLCLTPVGTATLPIPYPNQAESKDLELGSITVTADGGNSIAVAGSKFSKSKGDSTGSSGGIISGCTQGAAMFISWSPNVTIEGRPVCRKTDKMLMNMSGVVPNTVCLSGVDQPDLGEPEEIEEPEWFETKLIDDESGDPLPRHKCLVIIDDDNVKKTRSDKDAIIKLKGVPAGDYTVVVL